MNPLFFVQIVLESLPISSSGHIFFLSALLFLSPLSTFEVFVAHIPTLFILIALFYKRLYSFFAQHTISRALYDVFVLAIATLVTTLTFILTKLYPYILSHVPVWYGFLITSLSLLVLKRPHKSIEVREYMTLKDGFFLGIAQSIALLPGVSRFAITLLCGLILKFEYRYNLLVSVLLQIALCFGGAGLSLIYALWKGFSVFECFCVHDIFITFIVSLVAYVLLYAVVQMYLKENLWKFGLYMFFPAAIIFFYKDSFWKSCATIIANVLSDNGVQWL